MEDRLTEDAVPEILAFLNFKLASTDQDFLERYLQWRIENPIVK